MANPYVTDGTAAQTDTGTGFTTVTSKQSANITTTNASDLIIVVANVASTSSAPSWSTSTLFNNYANSLSHGRIFMGEHIVSSTQTNFNDTASWTTAEGAAVVIAAFQGAAAGAAFLAPRPLVIDQAVTTAVNW